MLSRPSSLIDLIRQSDSLRRTSRYLPVIAAVFGIQESSCLTIRPSGLSPLNFPELPPSTSAGSPTRALPSDLPCRHWPSSRRRILLALPLPCNQLHAGVPFNGSFVSSRYGPPVCSTPLLIRPELLFGRLSLLLPGFQRPGHPMSLPDITTVPHWDLHRPDFHRLVQQLASLR